MQFELGNSLLALGALPLLQLGGRQPFNWTPVAIGAKRGQTDCTRVISLSYVNSTQPEGWEQSRRRRRRRIGEEKENWRGELAPEEATSFA